MVHTPLKEIINFAHFLSIFLCTYGYDQIFLPLIVCGNFDTVKPYRFINLRNNPKYLGFIIINVW